MPEGDGTVLDNSCLMFLSGLSLAVQQQQPIARAAREPRRDAEDRPLAQLSGPACRESENVQLYLSLMDRIGGYEFDHFGDADSRLARL